MKNLFLILCLLLFPIVSFAQVSDTVYVYEVDTIIVKQEPVVVNQTVYHKAPKTPKKKTPLTITPAFGVLWDFSNYEVCAVCEEEFKKLKAASSYTRSIQYSIFIHYLIKKVSIGLDLSYRNSSKTIDYSSEDSSFQLNSTVKVSYFMAGPSLGYKVLQKKFWDFDLYGGVLFSFTTDQSGKTIAGQGISQLIDLKETALISTENFLYHLAPTFSLKAGNSVGITFAPHYYFDQNSNVTKSHSYTEQRNSVGITLGIKYRL